MAVLFAVGMFAAEELKATLDFTSAASDWGIPTSLTMAENSYENGDYTIKLYGGTVSGKGYKANSGYLLFGQTNASLTLPAFSWKTTKIVVEGNSGASASVIQNIFVGDNAVSTATTGATGTNTYEIAADNQAAGNVYVLKVTSKHNTQVKSIQIWGEKESTPDPDPEPTEQTLYLKLSSDWAGWPAKYAVYYFNDTENGWSNFMTEVEGETNTYTTTIPLGYSKVIFVRLDGNATATSWDSKWSQTVNLTIPEGKNHFTVTSGGTGSECDGTWSVYPVVPTYYVKGTFNDWGEGYELENGSYTLKNLDAKMYAIKVTDGASEWYGIESLDADKSSKYIYGADNIEFTLAEKGDVTVAFDTKTKKVTVTGNFAPKTTTFTVNVPKGTDSVFVCGSWDNWVAFHKMAPVVGEDDQYTLTIEGEYANLEYKYLAGPDWKYEEVREGNRSWAAEDNVTAWAKVPTANKYAKVKEAPLNWTGHYIIAFEDLKPHTAISGSDFVAATGAQAFVDGDTIQVAEGYDVEIRFGETAGTYTVKLPNGKYLAIPSSSNAMSEQDAAFAFTMAYFKGENQEGVQLGNGDLTLTSTRMMYKNSNYFRSYTNKIDNASYKLPTLYRLVGEAYDCQDGPYAILVNGKDVVEAAKGDEFDGYTQYVANVSLTKGDIIQVMNTSCGATWMPAIEEGGVSKHFDADAEMAAIDTTGCFDLYIKMKAGDDKLYIGNGICADDTVRFAVVGNGDLLGNWDFTKAPQSKENTLELDLPAGDYKLKVVDQNNFWYGFEQLSDTAVGLKELDADKNIGFTLKEAGKVTFTLIKTATDTTFTLAGNFYVRVPVLNDLQLVPGVWATDNAKIAAWTWSKTDEEYADQWTAFFAPKAEGNDTLVAKLDAAVDSVIFVRFNNAAEAPEWNDAEGFIWNRMASDSVVKESMIYTITDWAEGTWEVYVPAKYYITGDSALVGSKELEWNEKAIKAVEDATELNLKAGDYKLKVVAGGNWLGFDKLTAPVAKGLKTDNDGNIKFTLKEDGKVTVTFAVVEEDTTFTLAGNFYTEPMAKITLVPGVWNADNAKFAAVTWKVGETMDQNGVVSEAWFVGTDTVVGEIPVAADSIAFARFSSEAVAPSLNMEVIWNHTDKLLIDKETMIYTISGWQVEGKDYCPGYWGAPYVPTLTNGFYLVGNKYDWTPAAERMFVANTEKEGEYYLENIALAVDDSIKVAYVENDAIKDWYPGEGGDNYVVDADHAGVKTIYFNPKYQEAWGNNIWIAANPKYYAKYAPNWNWTLLTEKDGLWQTDTIVYAGIGLNINDKASDENNMFYSNTSKEEGVRPIAGVEFAELDTVYFTFNPADSVVAVVMVGKYVKPEQKLADGYYLIGLGGWDVEDLDASVQFTVNPGDAEEYMLEDITLQAGDKFKAVYVENDAIKTWYPDGEGNDYEVTSATAGKKTVYFRPKYHEEWNGHFYIAPNDPTAIDDVYDNVKAVKVMRDGQILIIKGNKIYNVLGETVQ